MRGFIDSCKPLFQKVTNSSHRSEAMLLGMSVLTLLVTITVYSVMTTTDYTQKQESTPIQTKVVKNIPEPVRSAPIYIHVSGGVVNPDVYKSSFGTRVYQAIERAGGLSEQAATLFISRNINFARIMFDQEKIYIPTYDDIQNGYINEYGRVINDSFAPPSPQPQSSSTDVININSSPIEELDSLPGIGPALGQKIIDGRPYNTVDDLVVKKIISDSVFQKIRQLITTFE